MVGRKENWAEVGYLPVATPNSWQSKSTTISTPPSIPIIPIIIPKPCYPLPCFRPIPFRTPHAVQLLSRNSVGNSLTT